MFIDEVPVGRDLGSPGVSFRDRAFPIKDRYAGFPYQDPRPIRVTDVLITVAIELFFNEDGPIDHFVFKDLVALPVALNFICDEIRRNPQIQ